MTEPNKNAKDAASRFDAARETARRETFRLARDSGARIVTRPAYSMPSAPVTRDVEPLAGARTALDLELAARGIARDYVRQAREAGHDWDQIAQALGVNPSGEKLADLAFDYVVGRPDPEAPWAPRYFSWTCPSCDKHITDRGLIQGPVDDEIGHADDCPRLAAAIAERDAQIAEWDADWEAGQ
jgi:hypothetical protein